MVVIDRFKKYIYVISLLINIFYSDWHIRIKCKISYSKEVKQYVSLKTSHETLFLELIPPFYLLQF